MHSADTEKERGYVAQMNTRGKSSTSQAEIETRRGGRLTMDGCIQLCAMWFRLERLPLRRRHVLRKG